MSKLVSTHDTTIYDFCPIGAIIAFPATAIPSGWLECNGQAISRSRFADLSVLIGTTYGAGDGSTTFNLPDYRGSFLRGLDNGKGYDTGRTLGSYQEDDFKSHKHSGLVLAGSGPYYWPGGSDAGAQDTGYTGGTETRPKNVSVVYCIKATMAMAASASTVSTFASLTHNTHQGEVVSFGDNGYKKFADGTMLQWGIVTLSTTSLTFTFPVAFPETALCMTGTFMSGASLPVFQIGTLSATQAVLYQSINQSSQFRWFAIGR